ncbi:hypothetical protein TNCV_458531 [Trichonephila clavipes]|nr:hypothetical protein TNCV_458531 [Trichonephila clavipes]
MIDIEINALTEASETRHCHQIRIMSFIILTTCVPSDPKMYGENIQRCAILAPKNDDINRINDMIIFQIPGAVTEYKSIDTVINENDDDNYTVEYLNSLEPSGIPRWITDTILWNLNTSMLSNGRINSH